MHYRSFGERQQTVEGRTWGEIKSVQPYRWLQGVDVLMLACKGAHGVAYRSGS
jgi:hypothetical protein